MLYPQTGRRLRDAWDSPYNNAWLKYMSKGRFLQISSVLHFNNNDDEEAKRCDSLHKVRPLLNIVKKTLGRYATFGSELSYDEATMANKSSYGRSLICYNPMKPTGKFHFKIYMLCCAKTNLTLRMKIHTKDNSDVDGDENFDEMMNKLDNATVQICRPLFQSGTTVNMDNYYMSTTCAMKLRQNGVLCRGTIRSSRKFVPKSILFTPSEVRTLPRGTQRLAVNHEHQMIAVGWIDNKAVHFVSTADVTDTVTVLRRVGGSKIEVKAPLAISNYNKYMGGVDRHDRLRSTFSLCKKHKFKKYYVKLLLFIMDIGLTNSWIYYKMCNEQVCNKDGSRADFFQAIAEIMVNGETNWKGNFTDGVNELQSILTDNETNNLDNNNDAQVPGSSNGNLLSTDICLPMSLTTIPAKLSTKIKVCQVCKYELRSLKWKSVTLCPKHGVRLCTEVRKPRQECLPLLIKEDKSPVTDWSWTCPTTDSCWNKFHTFYQPLGLFNSNFALAASTKCKFSSYIYTSPLYQKKYASLGIQVKLKAGRVAGMGKVNEKLHIVRSKPGNKEVRNYSDDENGSIQEIFDDEMFEDAQESEVE